MPAKGKRKPAHRSVPCNGCTLCCRGDAIRLLPEDHAEIYLTEPHPTAADALMLAHKSNGECIYLDGRGCTIHDRAPSLCRSADCRSIALAFGFEQAMRMHHAGKIDLRVWDQGRKLLEIMRQEIRKENH